MFICIVQFQHIFLHSCIFKLLSSVLQHSICKPCLHLRHPIIRISVTKATKPLNPVVILFHFEVLHITSMIILGKTFSIPPAAVCLQSYMVLSTRLQLHYVDLQPIKKAQWINNFQVMACILMKSQHPHCSKAELPFTVELN